ncbi:hypothetical protein LQ327_23155 [Actinomycetospora endophytica]|uniref:Uncharacterized protein n=1 Tax=Actinomycetospora endophytica TaxID=2291215 RepID=A0ABS8PDC7_9PSEU|nr:hypothetical protein [Actinomycetospora endophytica]MCD2196277.1 hypothetical protein [Actinomycetospora endophytica]
MRLGRRLTSGIAEDPPAPTPVTPAVADDDAPTPVVEARATSDRVPDPAVSGN